jgi:hypothetical protein
MIEPLILRCPKKNAPVTPRTTTYWSKKLRIFRDRLGCFCFVLASPPDWLRAGASVSASASIGGKALRAIGRGTSASSSNERDA